MYNINYPICEVPDLILYKWNGYSIVVHSVMNSKEPCKLKKKKQKNKEMLEWKHYHEGKIKIKDWRR